MNESSTEKVSKVRRLVDVRIVIDPPSHLYWGNPSLEQLAKDASRWAKEFEEFVRDHRSQDPVSISIEREFQTQCSSCGAEWEEELYDDDGDWHCANCGKKVEIVR